MLQKHKLRLWLVAGLFFLSLGGWLLHLRIHPLSKLPAHYIPFFAGLLGCTLLPALFLFRKTTAYAYVINGMLVILGTITMAHFSLSHLPAHITFSTLFMGTMFPDIAMLLGNFAVGKTLFELQMLRAEDTPARRGRFFRYPNLGWWLVHLLVLSVVYALGHLIWT